MKIKLCSLCFFLVTINLEFIHASRSRRFLDIFWPSASDKSEDAVRYNYASPRYFVQNTKEIENRAGVVQQRPSPNPQIKPFMRPVMPAVKQSNNENYNARVTMRPIAHFNSPNNVRKQQPLPDIHKTYRFSTQAPVIKTTRIPVPNHFNVHQSLPIKRQSTPVVISTPVLSVKTAPIADFYYTKEFNDLLKEYKIRVNIKKLPNIKDVMALLGTDTGEETLKLMREIIETKEGMDLISSYIEGTDRNESDDFYNFEEDVGEGEILVNEQEGQKPNYVPSSANDSSQSWWHKSLGWLGLGDSTKIESLQKDKEILTKVVPKPNSFYDGIQYVGKFLTPASKDAAEINPPFKFIGTKEATLVESKPVESLKVLPAIRLTEEQFEEMKQALHLEPLNKGVESEESEPIIPAEKKSDTQVPNLNETKRNFITTPEPVPQNRVESKNEYTEIRRNFVKTNEPTRVASEYFATGSIYRANPDAVLKESRSLSNLFEDEKEVVAAVSNLTAKQNE